MAVIRVHQPHTLSTHRQRVDDAAAIVGEQAFVLQMFSALNPAEGRCAVCFDEVYTNSATSSVPGNVCSACYGTTYDKGIDKMFFTKVIVGRAKANDSMEGAKGQASMVSHRASTTYPARLHRNDYVIRVFEWDTTDENVVRPQLFEAYKIVSSPVTTVIKDGFNPTGMDLSRVGSVFDLVMQDENHPLNKLIFPALPRKLVVSKTPFVYIPDYNNLVYEPNISLEETTDVFQGSQDDF